MSVNMVKFPTRSCILPSVCKLCTIDIGRGRYLLPLELNVVSSRDEVYQ